MSIVADQTAEEIENCALSLRMQVLIEVHDEKDLERALTRKAKLISINNRIVI
ncbi:hypothetical protein B488_03030 [Liberibacter crescens BT-1]|uniref:indole-3-glycerol-phosphate synthase n=1 Tax=Liberibacter crescens (strain BT-1) TaxID=1215343 RepID=L0EV73_LIBCB|nr:hypothetical protein B488_03030 [Liberibacter crescens BT-1]